MKTMSSRCGIIGSAAGPSCMFAPLPFAHHSVGSTPFEKNTIPSRSGGVFVFTTSAACPNTGKRLHPRQRQRDAHAPKEMTP